MPQYATSTRTWPGPGAARAAAPRRRRRELRYTADSITLGGADRLPGAVDDLNRPLRARGRVGDRGPARGTVPVGAPRVEVLAPHEHGERAPTATVTAPTRNTAFIPLTKA